MEYLFILDFVDSRVYKYKVSNMRSLEYEDFIIEKGHSLSMVDWMVTTNPNILSGRPQTDKTFLKTKTK